MTYMRAILLEEGSPLFFCGLVSRRNSTCGDWPAAGDT